MYFFEKLLETLVKGNQARHAKVPLCIMRIFGQRQVCAQETYEGTA